MNLTIRLDQPETLDEKLKSAYGSLLTTKDGKLVLEGRSPLRISDAKVHLFGAYLEEELIGCCAFSDYKILPVADLHEVAVSPDHRRKGVATHLLQEFAAHLRTKKIHTCYVRYVKENPVAPVLEHLLIKLGWNDPIKEKETYFFDGPLFTPPWLHKDYPLPPGCKLFPWPELTPDERDEILRMERQRTFPEAVSPLKSRYAVEPLNSLGIRSEGRVVAWMITHRITKDLIRYSALYVHPDFRFTHCFFLIIIEAIRRQKKSSVRWASCIVNPSEVFPTWRRFARKYLRPYADHEENLYVATLSLQ